MDISKIKIPYGWKIEQLSVHDADTFVLYTHRDRDVNGPRYMATIDFRERTVRSGMSCSGSTLFSTDAGRKQYGGRNWRQAVVDDAIAHLREVLR